MKKFTLICSALLFALFVFSFPENAKANFIFKDDLAAERSSGFMTDYPYSPENSDSKNAANKDSLRDYFEINCVIKTEILNLFIPSDTGLFKSSLQFYFDYYFTGAKNTYKKNGNGSIFKIVEFSIVLSNYSLLKNL